MTSEASGFLVCNV